MPSIIPGYQYDIFISYRHKDNFPSQGYGRQDNDGWVTEFVKNLKRELESTFKESVSIYFDENPVDGLHETHDVDDSLKEKIKCLIFIPIVSRIYCDTNSFAWEKEFLAFLDFASSDPYGLKIKLPNGNVSSRVLPIRIHDIDREDVKLFEEKSGGVMRSLDFIFRSTGVNRPLAPDDDRKDNLNHTYYRDQINKVAMSIREIITALQRPADATTRSTFQSTTGRNKKSFSGKITVALLALILICLFGYGITYSLKKTSIEEAASEENINRSIAVLPFADMSVNKDQEYFSDGLSEELLNLLAKIPELKVISRTSAFSFKGKNEDIRSIGEKLGVEYLLEGSVRKSDDKIRITAQLIKASDGTHLWSDTFDKNMNDIFKVQDEIANAVVTQLKIKLIGNKPKVKESKGDVYNLWLQAEYFLNLVTAENTERALTLLKRAHDIDSLDARVWGGFGIAYFLKSNDAKDIDEIRSYTSQAGHASQKALSLDENLLEGYEVLANIAVFDWQLTKAQNYLKRALERDPANAGCNNSMANVVRDLGRYDEAEALYMKSIELDPLRPTYFFNLSNNTACKGNFKLAEEQIRKALAITSRPIYYTVLSTYLVHLGKIDDAMLQIEKCEDPFWRDYSRCIALSAGSTNDDAGKALKKFIEDYSDVGAFQIAEVYAWRKEIEKMYEWLDIAYEQRDPGLIEIKSSVFMLPYRHESRHKEILRKLDLPE